MSKDLEQIKQSEKKQPEELEKKEEESKEEESKEKQLAKVSFFQHPEEFYSVNLSNKGISTVENINQILKKNDHYRVIDLSFNNITDDFISALFQGVKLPRVERIFLDHNKIGDNGVKSLVEFITAGNVPLLQYLQLNNNNIVDGSALGNLFSNGKGLKQLKLSYNYMDSSVVEVLKIQNKDIELDNQRNLRQNDNDDYKHSEDNDNYREGARVPFEISSAVNNNVSSDEVKEISEKIRDGYRLLQGAPERPCIVLMGDTGVGKTTLFHILSGKEQLLVRLDEDTGEYYITLNKNSSGEYGTGYEP